jgi:hypothetical protein
MFTFRLRAPKGLDTTLVKELRNLKIDGCNQASIRKVPGRKAVEVQGE